MVLLKNQSREDGGGGGLEEDVEGAELLEVECAVFAGTRFSLPSPD